MEGAIFCNECGKVFSTNKTFNQHQDYHDENEVECSQCEEKFKGKKALKNHERKRKTTICPHCSIVISYHNKWVHQFTNTKVGKAYCSTTPKELDV